MKMKGIISVRGELNCKAGNKVQGGELEGALLSLGPTVGENEYVSDPKRK